MCFSTKINFLRVFGSNTLQDTAIRRKLNQEYAEYRKFVSSKPKAAQLEAYRQFQTTKQVLFDIVKDKGGMDADQTVFFEDQVGSRTRTVSEFLIERELSGVSHAVNMVEENLPEEMEVDVDLRTLNEEASDEEGISDDEEEAKEQEDNQMYYELRSGKRRRIELEETNNEQEFEELPLRVKAKVCSKECIEAIVKMNVACHTSINQSRKGFMIVLNTFNGQKYTLEPEEKPTKMPRTKSDFEKYRNVVPSEKTLWHHRHHYALSE